MQGFCFDHVKAWCMIPVAARATQRLREGQKGRFSQAFPKITRINFSL